MGDSKIHSLSLFHVTPCATVYWCTRPIVLLYDGTPVRWHSDKKSESEFCGLKSIAAVKSCQDHEQLSGGRQPSLGADFLVHRCDTCSMYICIPRVLTRQATRVDAVAIALAFINAAGIRPFYVLEVCWC